MRRTEEELAEASLDISCPCLELDNVQDPAAFIQQDKTSPSHGQISETHRGLGAETTTTPSHVQANVC